VGLCVQGRNAKLNYRGATAKAALKRPLVEVPVVHSFGVAAVLGERSHVGFELAVRAAHRNAEHHGQALGASAGTEQRWHNPRHIQIKQEPQCVAVLKDWVNLSALPLTSSEARARAWSP